MIKGIIRAARNLGGANFECPSWYTAEAEASARVIQSHQLRHELPPQPHTAHSLQRVQKGINMGHYAKVTEAQTATVKVSWKMHSRLAHSEGTCINWRYPKSID